MHYVKHFTIKGVDTKQTACIELQGAPNAATEGAVGVLGIDITSPTHDVYKCVAVNGSIYTWELLSAGMSIISAKISREGALTSTFPYNQLVVPNNYILKVGDLILDSEGYLYRVTAIGANSCTVEYGNTHIGGMASGDNDRRLTVENGKLQLVTESGNVLSELDYLLEDSETIYRNPDTGKITVIGIRTVNGELFRLFVGSKEDYANLKDEQQKNLCAFFTDDDTKDELLSQFREELYPQKCVETVVLVTTTNSDGQTVNVHGLDNLELTEGKTYVFSYLEKNSSHSNTYILHFANKDRTNFSTSVSIFGLSPTSELSYEKILCYNPISKQLYLYIRYTNTDGTSNWERGTRSGTIYYREI